jgi:major membrane immunogen (membrane-anchored lipoprotein)
MKRWIGAGLLAATLMVTGCAGNGYGRGYRYDRDYRYRNYRDGHYRDGHYRDGHYRDSHYRDNDDRHRDYDHDNWR